MMWKKYKLGDVLKRRKETIRILPEENYKLVTIKLYHKGVILRGISKGSQIKSAMSLIHAGDFVLSGIDARNGAFGIVPAELEGAIVTNDFWCLDPDESVIDKEFLLFLTGTEFFDFICKQSSDGTTQRIRLQREKFFNYELKLPPVLEQKVLVKKLTALKSENEDLAKGFITQVELLRQLRQAFFREAIQGKLVPQDPDDEPASDLLARIKAEKEQLIKSNKIKRGKELPPIKPEEIPFEIPENWVWCRLGDIGTLRRGKSKHRPRNDQQLFKSGIYPFIQTGDVSKAKFNKDLITTVNGYYNEFGLGQSEMQKKGTLCITIAANIAECGFLDFDACVPDSIVCFTSIDKIIEKYVYYYLKTAKEELEKFAPATAQKNINLGILNDLVLPLPPLSECSRIGAKLEQVMHGCDRLDQRITQSKAQNEQMFQQVLREALRPDNRERKSVHAETSTWGVQFGWSAEP